MFKKIIALVFVTVVSVVVYAATKDTNTNVATKVNSEINQSAIKTLIEDNTRLQVQEITPSLIAGLAEVLTDQGYFYASNDGKYFLPSKVYKLSPMGLVDINEERNQARLAAIRLDGLKEFKQGMIEYPAKNEKHVITVFTDITCGYCRKMHALMDEYNELGITVRYLAYPRQGVTDQKGELTPSFKDLRSIWCNDNPAQALTQAKAGGGVEYRECDAPVEAEFYFGMQAGVNGTPAILLENGYLLPGFRGPTDLLNVLEKL